jgi:hypothetical protein
LRLAGGGTKAKSKPLPKKLDEDFIRCITPYKELSKEKNASKYLETTICDFIILTKMLIAGLIDLDLSLLQPQIMDRQGT